MKPAKRIGRIVLVVLGVFIIWLGVRGLMDVPECKNAIGSAVYLEEPVVLPENEGRMVIIHGEPEMIAPVYDEELGLTLQTLKAYRYDEEYKLVSKEKGTHKWNWQGKGQKTLVGEAVIGGFELDEKTLGAFPIDTDRYYENFDAQEISAYGTGYGLTQEGAKTDQLWVIRNGQYYYDEHSYNVSDNVIIRDMDQAIINEREGARAYSYRYYDDARHGEITVAGIQQGNTLVALEKIGPMVYNGVKTRDELLKTQGNAAMGGAIVFLVIGLVLVALGLRKSGKNKQKRTK